MNDIIHLLPDSVANQIAAGEVIQRPSSVIKELVENAIDAGATEVKVYVTDAGRTCIQVIDNGKGMSETDARLSFERHATSKIQKAEDLFALHTMGFRGEALASIAAIAEVELRTRREEDELGTCVCIAGSRITSQEAVACPVGANFAVRNLFFNVPARRKFLKSNHTELANIISEFERITIAHANVRFSLYNNEQLLLDLPAGNFHQRILGLFGKRVSSQLLPVNTETELVRISGYVGAPDSAKKKGAHQFFITNSRYMRHGYFAKAIQTAYERLIPDAYTVPFFLNLEVSPEQIDVNVHPTKTEIKFTDETDIWQIILVAVREALGKHNAIPSLDFNTADKPDIPVFAPDPSVHRTLTPPTIKVNPDYNPFFSTPGSATSHTPVQENLYPQQFDFKIEEAAVEPAPLIADTPELASGEYFQYAAQYIITPTTQGLMLIHQHRASHRILYEQYRQRLQEGTSATQGLLFPQIIQLSPTLASVAESLSNDLATLGFNISNLGGGSYSILGTPIGTEGIDPVTLLQNILDEAQGSILDDASSTAENARETIHHTIANAMARRAALPIGEILSSEEMAYIHQNLMATSLPGYTPDGLKIIIEITADKLAQLFG